MLQAVVVGCKQVDIRDVLIPEVHENDVLIRIERIGVCGSDIHVYHGVHLYNEFPIVQGHEVAGEIVETGENVSGFAVGDKVTIQPQVVCGKCYQCTHGNYHVCDQLNVLGFQVEGAASEFYVVDSKKVLKLPDTFSYDEGAMIEPAAVAVHAVKKLEDASGKNILVLGAGPIGNLVAQVCKANGAQAVMITDVSDFRLKRAEKCGIDHCVNVQHAALENELVRQFGDGKADAIFECVGSNATINQAIDIARKLSPIVVIGVLGAAANINMGIVQDHELKMLGSLMYQKDDMETAINLVGAGKINVVEIITHHFPIKAYNEAYQTIDEQKDKTMKVMITV